MRELIRAPFVYLLISTAAAVAAPLVGGPQVSVAVWLGGALVLAGVLVRNATRRTIDPETSSLTLRLSLAILVAVSAAFFAFVLIVNVLERLGYAH
jgi:hypothetical protein